VKAGRGGNGDVEMRGIFSTSMGCIGPRRCRPAVPRVTSLSVQALGGWCAWAQHGRCAVPVPAWFRRWFVGVVAVGHLGLCRFRDLTVMETVGGPEFA